MLPAPFDGECVSGADEEEDGDRESGAGEEDDGAASRVADDEDEEGEAAADISSGDGEPNGGEEKKTGVSYVVSTLYTPGSVGDRLILSCGTTSLLRANTQHQLFRIFQDISSQPLTPQQGE